MNTEIWQKLDQVFAEFPVMRADGVPASEIRSASEALGRRFDPDYCEFVARYGGAIVGPYPVFGLRRATVMGNQWSVVDETKWFWAEHWRGVEDWYIVSLDHCGNPIGIAPNGCVMISDHDAGDIAQVAPSFEGFIAICLAGGRHRGKDSRPIPE